MSEAFDKALEREARRYRPEQLFRDVTATSVADVVILVAEFAPAKVPNVIMETTMEAADHGGSRLVNYKVTAEVPAVTRRQMLLDGLTVVKRHLDAEQGMTKRREAIVVNGVEITAAAVAIADRQFAVDKLIRRWFGARRDGIYVRWDLRDGAYFYDVWTHKLFKQPTTNANQTAS